MATKNAPGVLIAVGLIFIAAALIFMVAGVHLALRQARMLSSYLPVGARITSSVITSHRGSKGGTISTPQIRFTYAVDGRQESAFTPLITTQSGSYAWASRLVERFPAGTTTTAWHSPTEENQAFLVHEADFGVYAMILCPMLHFSLGAMMLLSGLGFGRGPAGRWTLLLTACGLWDLVGAAVFIHFMLVGGRWSLMPILALAIYGGLASVLTVYSIRSVLPGRPRTSSGQGDEPNPYRGDT